MKTLELDGWKAQRVGRGAAWTRKTNDNEVSLASAAPTASCSLIFSCFSRGASWHHAFTQLFGAEKHLWQQETLLQPQPQPHVGNTVRHLRSPTRHEDLASAPLLRRCLVPQRVNTLTLTCLVFLFCFVSIFFFLKGMLRIIMGNFAQMRRSRTDVLLCSLILTWHGAPAENIPGAGAELKQAKQQNQRSWRCCTKAAQSREPSRENDETKPNTSNSSHSQTFRAVSWSWRPPEIEWFVDLLKVWQIQVNYSCTPCFLLIACFKKKTVKEKKLARNENPLLQNVLQFSLWTFSEKSWRESLLWRNWMSDTICLVVELFSELESQVNQAQEAAAGREEKITPDNLQKKTSDSPKTPWATRWMTHPIDTKLWQF